MFTNSNGNNNTAIGNLALYTNTLGDNNTALGHDSGRLITGDDADYNLTLGSVAGDNITSGAGNVIIGSVDADSATGDRQLKIAGNDGSTTTTWIDGDSSGNLTFKRVDTGDDNPYVLTLQTGETDIASADILGSINFQAPDEGTGTDAILVAAGIDAVSEGDFAADNNATKLSFKTAASEAAAEKMSLSSGGNLTVAGTIGSGAVTSTSTVQGTTITATTAFAPDAQDGAALGTTSLQFSDLFFSRRCCFRFW